MRSFCLSRCPIKSAIQRQTAHTARSRPLQKQLQGLLLAAAGFSYLRAQHRKADSRGCALRVRFRTGSQLGQCVIDQPKPELEKVMPSDCLHSKGLHFESAILDRPKRSGVHGRVNRSSQPYLYQLQQRPDTRSHGMAMAVRPQQLQRGRTKVQWYFLQSARSKVFLAGVGSHNREADALPCASHGQLSAVDAVAAADRHLDDFARSVLKLPGLTTHQSIKAL